jgi:hypothetical protein
MKAQPIVIKELALGELIAFETYALKESYGSPIRETDRQAEKRMLKQDRWREILGLIRAELKRRTEDVR